MNKRERADGGGRPPDSRTRGSKLIMKGGEVSNVP